METHTSEVGKPLDRLDAVVKVTGRAKFGADFTAAENAHAVIVASTVPAARIASLDVAAARRAPGVIDILTHRNAPKLTPAPPSRPFFLQSDRVQFDGEPVAVVVAETLEQAEYAAQLVRVRYVDEREAVVTLATAAGRAVTPATMAMDVMQPADSTRGDVSEGIRSAAVVVDHVYTSPTHNHNPLEPHAALASWQDDHLTVYTGTQGVSWAQSTLAKAFGLAPATVHVLSPFTGGGFGSKALAFYPILALAASAARRARRPVRLALSRRQMFTMVGRRAQTRQHLVAAADPRGRLTALRHDVLAEASTAYDFCDSTAFSTRSIYACPNVAVSHRTVRMNIPIPVSMRGPGDSVGMFALESALDELAHELRIDPVELRKRNVSQVDAHTRLPWSSNSLLECYDVGAERFRWHARNPVPRSMRHGGQLVGWGMASLSYPQFKLPAAATARLYADGTATVRTASQELGNGNSTVMAQVAADAFGISVEKVRFELGNSDFPVANPSVGSMTTASLAPAVAQAAHAALQRAIALAVEDPASALHGLRAPDLLLDGIRLRARTDSERSETLGTLMARHHIAHFEGHGSAVPESGPPRFAMRSFGAHFVEVGVDEDTLETGVLRMVTVTAVGRVLNEKLARSQLIGGVVFGIGQALMEQTVADPATGRVLTKSLADYHVPTSADVPFVEAIFVGGPDAHVSDVGAKTLGMNGAVGSAAAIANAVFHATGKRFGTCRSRRRRCCDVVEVHPGPRSGLSAVTRGAGRAPHSDRDCR